MGLPFQGMVTCDTALHEPPRQAGEEEGGKKAGYRLKVCKPGQTEDLTVQGQRGEGEHGHLERVRGS